MKSPKSGSSDNKFKVLMDEVIGSGTSRKVYSIKGTPDFVIKESQNPLVNQLEEEFFQKSKNVNVDRYLGTIDSISETGKYLVMEFLSDIAESEITLQCPKEVTDMKLSNFGKNKNGDIKMRDFGLQNQSDPSGEIKSIKLGGKEFDEINEMYKKLKNLGW